MGITLSWIIIIGLLLFIFTKFGQVLLVMCMYFAKKTCNAGLIWDAENELFFGSTSWL